LSKSLPPTDGRKYKLISIVCHQGSKTMSGHYHSYTRQATEDWIRIDDQKVDLVPEKEVLNEQQNAYLLMYEKIEA